jgi:protein-tyrosine phosphatase
VVDLHSHILPGLDDGAKSLDEALAIARAAVVASVEVLAATPHVSDRYPTEPAAMELALADVQEAIADEGIALELVGGGEIALDYLPELERDDLQRFALGGSRALLLEFPYFGWPLDLPEIVFRLSAQGFRPVLAHPERNHDVIATPERLRPLVESGVLIQITSASLEGRLGKTFRDSALTLVERGLAHMLASDAHTAAIRAYGLRAGADALDDPPLARWLTRDVPAALLADEEVPERPRRKFRLPKRR